MVLRRWSVEGGIPTLERGNDLCWSVGTIPKEARAVHG